MPGRTASEHRSAHVALGVAVAAISAAAILIREADAAALTIAFWRTAIGAVALLPAAMASRRRRAPVPARDRALLALSGMFLAAHFGLWLGSLELTTVASSVTLVTLTPLFVASAAGWLLGEHLTPRGWAGVATAVAGAVVIGVADLGGDGDATDPLLGDLMAVGGAVAMAGYLVIGRHLRGRGMSNVTFAVPTYAGAATVLAVVVVLRDDPVVSLDARTWLLILAIVAGPQLLGHALLTWVLDRLPSTLVSVVTLLEPVGATILAWLVLDELPAELFWVGAPFVLAGLALVVGTGRRPSGAGVGAVSRW